jgi:hypothetical protein
MKRPDRRQRGCSVALCTNPLPDSGWPLAGEWAAVVLRRLSGAGKHRAVCLGNCSDRLRAAASVQAAHSLLCGGRGREGVREYTHSQHASIRFTSRGTQHSSRGVLEVLPRTGQRPLLEVDPIASQPVSRALSAVHPISPHTSPYPLRTSPRRRPHPCPHAALSRCCAPYAAQPNSTRSANLTPSPVPLSPCAAPSITTAAAS